MSGQHPSLQDRVGALLIIFVCVVILLSLVLTIPGCSFRGPGDRQESWILDEQDLVAEDKIVDEWRRRGRRVR